MSVLPSLLPLLPEPLANEIASSLSSPYFAALRPAEVRLRCGRIASLSLFRGGRLVNLPLSYIADRTAIQTTLARATGGSVFAFEEELKDGFFSLPGGVRVGVGGKAVTKEGRLLTLSSVESLVFRLPSGHAPTEALLRFFKESRGGILLFAPPGGGKTTLLRDFTEAIAKELRVAVIDSREEFFFSSPALLLDHLCGYPKAKGAEIALRTLSPELLVLDEVGTAEAAALASLVSFGVRTLASVHADSAHALLSAPALRPLLGSGLFSHLWDIKECAPSPLSKEASL